MARRAASLGRRAWLATVLLLAATPAAPALALEAAGLPDGGNTSSSLVQARPQFVPRACPDGVFPRRAEVECGFVRVPEDRARPGGRTITVAAAVIPASSGEATRSPLVFLDGGPSFGAVSSFAFDAYFDGAAYAENRDVVLVDTRGTGFSRPRLGCPEFDRASVESFYSDPVVDAERTAIYQRAVRECRERLTGRDIRLRSYNSKEGAADLDDLRRALGYRRWNLLAISADGVLGSTYLRLFPQRIRSVVLDSPVAPQHVGNYDYVRGLQENLDRVFDGCEADPECDARYPGLRGLLEAKIAELNEDPVLVTIPDFEPEPVTFRVDGAWLWWDAAWNVWPGNVFAPEAITWMLDNMWRATHGELEQVELEMIGTGPVTSTTNSFLAEGKTMSYLCRDVIGFTTRQHRLDLLAEMPWLAPDVARGIFRLPIGEAGCRIWDVGTAGARQHQPVVSDVPTLVLAGELDPGVPAYMARQADDGLTNAHYYELPAAPHLQLSAFTPQSWCGREIATAFLDAPHAELDATCVTELPPFDYSPPGPPERSRPGVLRPRSAGRLDLAPWLS